MMADDGTHTEIDAGTKAALADSHAASEAVFQEGNALESQGRLDSAAVARLEARLEEVSAQVDEAIANQIAKIGAPSPELARGKLFMFLRFVAVAACAFAVTGFVFEMTIGTGFILYSSKEYRAAMPWLLGLFVVLFGIGGLASRRARGHLNFQYRDPGFRWVIMVPLFLFSWAGMMVVAPLGWAAVAAWLGGEPVSGMAARAVSVGDLKVNYRGCDQTGDIEYNGVVAKICFEGRLAGSSPMPHERVVLAGRRTSLGLLIYEIRRD